MIKTGHKKKIDLSDTSQVMDRLAEIAKSASITILKNFTKNENCKFSKKTNKNSGDYYWMTLILISIGGVRVYFCAQFQLETAITIASLKLKTKKQLKPHRAIDCMKEFCNQTAGLIKRNLISDIKLTQVTLPIQCDVFVDHIFHGTAPNDKKKSLQSTIVREWACVINRSKVYCSISVKECEVPELGKAIDSRHTDKMDKSNELEFL